MEMMLPTNDKGTLHPNLIYSPHPLLAVVGRREISTPFFPGESITSYLERVDLHLGRQPVILFLNDSYVAEEDWSRTFPKQGDLITMRARVQDDGSEGGSDPLRTILAIIIVYWFAPWAAGELGWGKFGQAMIGMGGLMVLNQLYPPPDPYDEDNESPTYSLSGGGNRARLYQPLPLILGEHRVFPDLGAKVYTESIGDDQFLYQVFNFGLSDIELSQIRIGDTPLENYDHIELELSNADGALILFPSNVDTIAGGALTQAAGWVTRTSSIGANGLAIDLSGILFYSSKSGIAEHSVTLEFEYRKVGDSTWISLAFDSDPPPVPADGEYNSFVAAIFSLSYDVPDQIIQPGQLRITHGSRKPLRRTYKWNVAPGQYEVRVRRITADDTDSKYSSDITWSQLKTYQNDPADYTGQKRLAMKIKATAQLQGQIDALNAVCRATVPAWVTSAPAVQFDGVDDYIEVTHDATINPSNAITVEWYGKSNTANWNENGMLVSKRNAYILYPSKDSKTTQFYIYDGALKNVSYTSIEDITKPLHIIGTFDGTTLKIYENGVLKNTNNIGATTISSDTGNLFIGRDDGLARYFDGTNYHVRIYYRAITDTEATEHYNGIYKDETGLVLRHDYDEGTGTTAADKSGNGNDGTLINGPTWITSTWTDPIWLLQQSSNPAWLFLWLVRGKQINSRRVFGGDLPDSRIDIEAIKEWGVWCETKGLTCNLVFDRNMGVSEQLTVVARCGRASPTWASGTLGVVWDEDSQPAVAVFGMNNIKRSSFSVEYATEKLADEITVRFINPTLGWQPDTVRAGNTTNPEFPVTVELPGVTSEAQAGKEANLLIAAHTYRRRRITWETDFEGMVVQRGDVAILSHDLTQWGYSGRLVAGTSTQLTLGRKVPFTPSTNHYIGLRYPDGSYDVYEVDYQAGESDTITLTKPLIKAAWQASTAKLVNDEVEPTVFNGYYYICTVGGTTDVAEPTWPTTIGDTVVDGTVTWQNAGIARPYAPDDDPNHPPVDYTWTFEPKATPGKLVKIIDVRPIDEHYVRLIATDEDPNYYTAELNSYAYITPATYGANVPTIDTLEVTDTLVRSGDGFGVRIELAWDVTGEYGGARIRAGFNGTPLQFIGSTFNRRFEFEAPLSGTVDIEVTALNLDGKYGPASTTTVNYTILGKDRPPEDVSGLIAMQNGSVIVFRWNQVADIDVAGYEIRYGPQTETSWDDATALTKVTKGTTITSAAIPPGTWRTYIKALDTSGNFSANAPIADVEYVNTYDIILQQAQAPDWPGTRTNFVKHWTGVLLPDDQNLVSSYTNFEWCDQFVPTPYTQCIYEAPEIDIGFDDVVRIWGDIISALGPGVTTGEATPELQIDYRKAADAYGGWRVWDVGDVEARYIKYRLVLDTTVGKAKINGFKPTADQLEDTVQMQDVVIAAGGSVVTYPREFHQIPMVKVNVQGGSALFPTRENINTTQCTVHVWDSSGADAGGTVDIEITGV